ncbi:MAG: hypothetical protein ACK58L_22510 [Planctomycetota bacterium]
MSGLCSRLNCTAARGRDVMHWMLAISLGLACCSSRVADPDLWGHIQYGREVLQSGALPETATWTYLAENARWVNHENIAELLLAFSFDQFGTPGLIGLKLLAGCLLFGLLIFSARRSGVGWFVICLTCAVVGSNIQFHWHYRPQILTYVSLAALLTLWQWIFRDQGSAQFFESPDACRRLGALFRAVPLMCIWTNSHGGFAAGLAIMVAYHGMITFQCVTATGLKSWKPLVCLWGMTLVITASSVVNPYGFEHWAFMYDALTLPRPEISDWQPLPLADRDAIRFWSLIGLTIVGIWSVVQPHQRSSVRDTVRDVVNTGQNLPQWILLALLLWQGMSHCRHMAIVAVVFGFWMPRHLQVLIDRWQQIFAARLQSIQRSDRPRLNPRGMMAGSAVMVGLCLFRIGDDASDIVVDRSEFPVAAMEYLSEHRLQGRMLVTFNWAQYAIGCFGAPGSHLSDSRVAVDGRFETCYPRDVTDRCFDFWFGVPNPKQRYRSPLSPAYQPEAALDLGRPDLVLISRDQQPSVRVMRQRSDFALVYEDSIAELWVRRSVLSTIAGGGPLTGSEMPMRGGEQVGSVSFPALPIGTMAPLRLTRADR